MVMKHAAKLMIFSLTLFLVFAALPCLADAQPDESYPGETMVGEIYESAEEKSESNKPKVVTLANGVQVQRTPDDVGGYWHRPGDYNSYNTYYLKADERGCAACHADLVSLLDNMNYEHLDFSNTYGIDMEVQDCMICHNDGNGYLYTTYDFGTLIHGIHMSDTFDAMGGSCMTCHNATGDGNGLMLWEEAKYDVLQGITFLADVEGEFSFTQDKLTDLIFAGNWMSGQTTNSMAAASIADLPLDPDLFDNWEITVDGDVENPFTMTLKEMIEVFPKVNEIMTDHCVMNPNGGAWIATCDVGGFSITQLLEYAGVKEGATAVMSYASDGWNRGILLSELAKDDAILAYELNGERIPWSSGYPVATWNGAGSAASCIRNVVELRVISVPENEVKIFDGWKYEDGSGRYINKPAVGIFHFAEGQIIPAGEAWTFEGYADAYDKRIVAVEYSLDLGKTWTRFDTEGTDRKSWVYWYFTYTPENTGAYVLSVRAITEDGLVTTEPEQIMFNAK
ncbi:MAG: molybdopterin-dependent oxidoreductase [Clostridia bacterium]|nr:molybdopterin-dependent oxidoreductase [Clostridia bacterium]